jgi:hypothetical protein
MKYLQTLIPEMQWSYVQQDKKNSKVIDPVVQYQWFYSEETFQKTHTHT